MTVYTVPAPKSSGPWRYATHGVGSKSDGGIYTCDINGRHSFATRSARRRWLDPRARPGSSKYAHGGFVPVILGETNERKNVNVRGSDAWVVLDFDGLPDDSGRHFGRLAHLTGEWFTSFSHGVKPGGRVRMVLELDHGLAYDRSSGIDEISPVRAAASLYVAETLGLDVEKMLEAAVLDRLCWRPSQYFNIPCHDPARPADVYFAEFNGGHVLSVDALLERGRTLVRTAGPTTLLDAGAYPEVTESDEELAEEDLDIVCRMFEEHRGSGFGNYYAHGKRLGGRIALGQLDYDEALSALTSAIEEGLADEAEAAGAEVDARLIERREVYVRSWLDDPYVHAGLVSPRLEFTK